MLNGKNPLQSHNAETRNVRAQSILSIRIIPIAARPLSRVLPMGYDRLLDIERYDCVFPHLQFELQHDLHLAEFRICFVLLVWRFTEVCEL